ncbi:MAG: DUF2842 domain-containing protein [Caulobacter sp.]
MNPRIRKAVGNLALMVFLFFYVVLALAIFSILPDNRFVHLVYVVVVGLGWGVPIIPLLTWMDKGRFGFK